MSDATDLHLRQKPPTREDEFFAREDRERVEALKEERRRLEAQEGEAHLKQMHWMCCPKCGQKLDEIEHNGILVDRCSGCRGVWLDAGEMEALVRKDAGISERLFGWLRAH
jgi:hypothetical protein